MAFFKLNDNNMEPIDIGALLSKWTTEIQHRTGMDYNQFQRTPSLSALRLWMSGVPALSPYNKRDLEQMWIAAHPSQKPLCYCDGCCIIC